MKAIILLLSVFLFICLGCFSQDPGDLFTSYGSDGISTFDYLGFDQVAYDMKIQEDDKVVIAGKSGSNTLIARFHPNGNLDQTFGELGKVIIDVGGNDYATCVDIHEFNEHRIVVCGNCNDDDVFILQLLQDGTIDNAFGVDGVNIIFTGMMLLEDALIQDGGKTIMVGMNQTVAYQEGVIYRFDATGIPDESFGDAGSVRFHHDDYDVAFLTVDIQDDGKIVAGGGIFNDDEMNAFVNRYNTDGSTDNTFGDQGSYIFDLSGDLNFISALKVYPDNKVVFGGDVYNIAATTHDIYLSRLTPDGNIDYSFGANGHVTYDFSDDELYDIYLRENMKILVCGSVDDDLFLMRTMENGSPDYNFGEGAFVLTDVFGGNDEARSIGVQSDLNIVIAGSAGHPGDDKDVVTAKYYSGLHVGIKDIGKENALIVYPVPASESINIVIPGKSNNSCLVELYSSNSQKVHSVEEAINDPVLEISDLNLPDGIYYLKAYYNGNIFTSKIVIMR